MKVEEVITIIVGAVVTFMVLSIILANPSPGSLFGQLGSSSGFGSAFILIFFSIFCTAGIGLFGWIVLWYGVGRLVFALIFKLVGTTAFYLGVEEDKGTGSKPVESVQQPQKPKLQALTERLNLELHNDPVLSRNQSALFNYIKKAREKGLTNEQISLNLRYTGWSADSVNWLLNFAGQQS
jgi:hypothetical protein